MAEEGAFTRAGTKFKTVWGKEKFYTFAIKLH
jgi:hypothetical protein